MAITLILIIKKLNLFKNESFFQKNEIKKLKNFEEIEIKSGMSQVSN